VSREAKLLERMRRDPRDVRPDELFDVLRAEGITVRRHGSHVGLRRGEVRMTLALPHGGEKRVKTPYVVEALKRFGLGEAGAVEETARRMHAGVDVHAAEDGGFIAELRELPGCMTHGDTRAGALANLEDAKACWAALGE
jgi:predicted RNA binding protein YcfA (HicA-like mRNA interferase family)